MITKNSQVRLTIELEGRLGAKASNANTKKERRLASILSRQGKSFYNEFTPSETQAASQSVTLSSEATHYFVSEEGKPARVTPSEWKRLSQIKRLEANLQIYADFISQHEKTKFSYSIID